MKICISFLIALSANFKLKDNINIVILFKSKANSAQDISINEQNFVLDTCIFFHTKRSHARITLLKISYSLVFMPAIRSV